MKQLDYTQTANRVLEAFSQGGAFLTAGKMGDANPMTIGWGAVEIMWNKGIFLTVVRPQRHTFPLLRRDMEFTVSVPTKNPLKKELAYCGTKSGRDGDKWAATGLTAAPGQVVKTPIVAQCGLHFECKVVACQTFEPMLLQEEIREKSYPGNDYHTAFYGEIVSCYTTDEE